MTDHALQAFSATYGTSITRDEPLAVARATKRLVETDAVTDILAIKTFNGIDTPYTVAIDFSTTQPISMFEPTAETIEVASYTFN